MNTPPLGLLSALACFALTLVSCMTGPKFTPAPVPAKSSNKALVYFYRPSKFSGNGGAFSLEIDGNPVGPLMLGGYYVINVSASRNIKLVLFDPSGRSPVPLVAGTTLAAPPVGLVAAALTAFYKDTDCGTYRFQSGNTYYFRNEVGNILQPLKTSITPVPTEVGTREIQECHLLKPSKDSIYH